MGNNVLLGKRSPPILKKTGFKNIELENSPIALDFFHALESGFNSKALKDNYSKDFFLSFYKQAKNISKTALAPISQAYYSSILVYKNKNHYIVHSGSNIDPLKKESLKIAKFRNCAEKQASLSALETDKLDNNNLKILFLFRLDNKVKKLCSEKLLPCKDCFDKYILDLQKNNGTLVLISEEMEADDFLHNGAKPKSQINFDNQFRFIFFQGDELTNLKLEAKLGSNINSK